MSSTPDAGRDDASVWTDTDAAQGGSGSGAGGSGASGSGMKDAAPAEAGAGQGGTDAQTAQDAGSMSMTDAGMDAAVSDADAMTSGMMDASATDAAISDAGTDAWVGSGLLCPPAALFCDGYENADFSKTWEYSVVTTGSKADQSTTTFHSGVGALHATTGAAHPNTSTTNAARWGTSLVFNQQKSGDVWARWYYYVPSSTSVTTLFSTGVIAEAIPPYFGFSMIIRPSRVDIGQGDIFYPGTAAFPRDRWVCVELHAVVAAAPSGVFELYLDGTRQIQATAVNTLPSTGYSSFDLGIHYTDPSQGPVEAYADDVAAGTTRIGCVP